MADINGILSFLAQYGTQKRSQQMQGAQALGQGISNYGQGMGQFAQQADRQKFAALAQERQNIHQGGQNVLAREADEKRFKVGQDYRVGRDATTDQWNRETRDYARGRDASNDAIRASERDWGRRKDAAEMGGRLLDRVGGAVSSVAGGIYKAYDDSRKSNVEDRRLAQTDRAGDQRDARLEHAKFQESARFEYTKAQDEKKDIRDTEKTEFNREALKVRAQINQNNLKKSEISLKIAEMNANGKSAYSEVAKAELKRRIQVLDRNSGIARAKAKKRIEIIGAQISKLMERYTDMTAFDADPGKNVAASNVQSQIVSLRSQQESLMEVAYKPDDFSDPGVRGPDPAEAKRKADQSAVDKALADRDE